MAASTSRCCCLLAGPPVRTSREAVCPYTCSRSASPNFSDRHGGFSVRNLARAKGFLNALATRPSSSVRSSSSEPPCVETDLARRHRPRRLLAGRAAECQSPWSRSAPSLRFLFSRAGRKAFHRAGSAPGSGAALTPHCSGLGVSRWRSFLLAAELDIVRRGKGDMSAAPSPTHRGASVRAAHLPCRCVHLHPRVVSARLSRLRSRRALRVHHALRRGCNRRERRRRRARCSHGLVSGDGHSCYRSSS